MKLTVEIIGNKLTYSWVIGESSRGGDMPFDEGSLLVFTALIEHLNKNTMNFTKERHKAFDAYVFAKAYPDLMKDVAKRIES